VSRAADGCRRGARRIDDRMHAIGETGTRIPQSWHRQRPYLVARTASLPVWVVSSDPACTLLLPRSGESEPAAVTQQQRAGVDHPLDTVARGPKHRLAIDQDQDRRTAGEDHARRIVAKRRRASFRDLLLDGAPTPAGPVRWSVPPLGRIVGGGRKAGPGDLEILERYEAAGLVHVGAGGEPDDAESRLRGALSSAATAARDASRSPFQLSICG
jgi:hypothetical protein